MQRSLDRGFAVVAVALALHGTTVTAAEPRPLLKDVSAIRIANYGTPSTVIKDRGEVSAIVEELRQLRNRAWRRGDTKFSCYATIMLVRGEKTVALFRVRPELVVERPQERGQSSYSLATGPADLPKIAALLAGIPPAKDCR